MELEAVQESLVGVERALRDVAGRRERLIKESRDVIASCSKSIIYIHTGKLESADGELSNAGRLLAELRKAGTSGLSRYLVASEAEFVEASAFNAIVKGRPIPGDSELGVGPDAYILGLLDCVGEMKRLLLDSMMRGKTKRARQVFESMEALYGLLSPFAAFDNVVGGTRRKIDVARMLIEDIRGVLAEEARREKLASSMEGLRKSLGERRRR